ncbi:MAG TPA: hypothetical protein PLV61_15870, partial [Parvularculaceae bacterium]|nr:hypothetical protein [Parvularculaceae bacterium]
MSIDDEIKAALASGQLHILELKMPSDLAARTVLIHPELKRLLDGPWKNDGEMRRIGRLQADLEAFVTGKVISMCLTPYNHRTAYMGLLDPPTKGIFDIRSRDPSPGMRVFGGFVMPDVFVALNYEFRSISPDWSDRRPLQADPIRWALATLECESRWEQIFSSPPITGGNVR